jgi:hypothetical protein
VIFVLVQKSCLFVIESKNELKNRVVFNGFDSFEIGIKRTLDSQLLIAFPVQILFGWFKLSKKSRSSTDLVGQDAQELTETGEQDENRAVQVTHWSREGCDN